MGRRLRKSDRYASGDGIRRRVLSPAMSALLRVSVGIVAGWVSIARAQSVHVRDGNVYFVPSSGPDEVQLTSSGRDREPSLSLDGRLVAFVRGQAGFKLYRDPWGNELGDGEASELWTINTDGTNPRLLLTGRRGREPKDNLTDMYSPRFSPDGGRIYFQTSAWTTSSAIHVIDVHTRRTRFVCPGNEVLRIVPDGKYRGHLLTCQHRHFLLGGSYDWLWLVTPEGKDVGPVSSDCDEGTVDKYLPELARWGLPAR